MNAFAELRHLSSFQRTHLETRVDPELGVYWAFMTPPSRPCISPDMLRDLRSVVDEIEVDGGWVYSGASRVQVRYGVIASKTPRVFSLGGDLALFRSAIRSGDRAALRDYGERCIDVLHAWHRCCDSDMTTLSLVQGEALGGGFEGALSANVLVAEESSRMGFPEVLFNLFPGMGAFSFLSRKVGRRVAERLIKSGSVYTARELYDLGVVDVITPDGTGEAAVYSYIRKHAKQGNGLRAFDRAKNEVDPITREELSDVLDIWVDAALKLDERDLKLMERLVRAQDRTTSYGAAGNVLPLQAASA